MVRGVCINYKQIVAYYLVKDTISTQDLKRLFVGVIQEVERTGLRDIATVCDQGATNRSAS